MPTQQPCPVCRGNDSSNCAVCGGTGRISMRWLMRNRGHRHRWPGVETLCETHAPVSLDTELRRLLTIETAARHFVTTWDEGNKPPIYNEILGAMLRLRTALTRGPQ
jgi:hypothetical protein